MYISLCSAKIINTGQAMETTWAIHITDFMRRSINILLTTSLGMYNAHPCCLAKFTFKSLIL